MLSLQVVEPDTSDTADALEKGQGKHKVNAGARPLQRDDTAHGNLSRSVEE